MFKRLGSYRYNKIKFNVHICGKQTGVVHVVQNKLTVAYRLKQVSVLKDNHEDLTHYNYKFIQKYIRLIKKVSSCYKLRTFKRIKNILIHKSQSFYRYTLS